MIEWDRKGPDKACNLVKMGSNYGNTVRIFNENNNIILYSVFSKAKL